MRGRRYAPGQNFPVGSEVRLAVDQKGRFIQSPITDMEDDEMLLNTGDIIETTDGGSVEVTVAGNTVDEAVYTPATTKVLVTDADTLDVGPGTVTFDVTASVLTAASFVPDTNKKVVTHGDVLDEDGGGTIEVSIVAGVAVYTYVPAP